MRDAAYLGLQSLALCSTSEVTANAKRLLELPLREHVFLWRGPACQAAFCEWHQRNLSSTLHVCGTQIQMKEACELHTKKKKFHIKKQ